MRKFIKTVTVLLAFCIVLGMTVLAAEESVPPESIKIILNTTVMEVGATQKIKSAVTPSNAENYELEYSSSDPQVVTAAIGTLIANAEGTADITVSIKGTEISDTVTVTVVGTPQEVVPVSDIVLTRSYMYLQRYDEEKIDYTVLPENADNQNVIFTSLNNSVATVDEDGRVYAKKVGSTQIKVQTEDESITKYVDVYVEYDEYDDDYDDGEIAVRRVDIYDGEDEVTKTVEIMQTQSKQFTAQIYPSGATDKRIRWRSSDDSITEVNDNGIVTGVDEGTATIYATARDNGRQDAITVKITPYVRYPDSISITPQEGAVFETGKVITFTAVFLPEDTTERNLNWVVNGSSAVSYGDGKITITDKGKVTVKAYSSDWKQSASYEFEAIYSQNHFRKLAEGFNLKSSQAVIIDFDEPVNQSSTGYNIFAATDESGNKGYTDIRIKADDRRIIITPVNDWSAGSNVIFIKKGLCDIYGNQIGENLKYIFTVRGNQVEKQIQYSE